MFVLKIAIIGPESTGKTDLTKLLADHYKCQWVPEFAREYIEQLDRNYDYNDVVKIAERQIKQEKAFEKINSEEKIIFFDTDLIITKVWFEYKYKKIPKFITERLSSRFFDFYLLSMPDLPWIYDPVREHGDDREFFYDWYKKEIENLGTPYAEIGGKGEKRLQNALKKIDEFIQMKHSKTVTLI